MTPERFAAIISKRGETMTLKRTGQSGLTLKGKRFGGTGDGVAGQIQTTRFNVKIANAEILTAAWPGPPLAGDRLELGGREVGIVEAIPLIDKGMTFGHRLTCEGVL